MSKKLSVKNIADDISTRKSSKLLINLFKERNFLNFQI